MATCRRYRAVAAGRLSETALASAGAAAIRAARQICRVIN